MEKSLRRWLWLVVIAIVIGAVFFNLSREPEWQSFSWGRMWSALVHAHPWYLLGAVAATYSSYLIRAYRWKFFLDPIKKASLGILFAGQILGFSAVYLTGRPGEFVRPAYIAKKENVPFSSMLAVWFLERIYDSIFMLLLFALALQVVPLHPTGRRGRLLLLRVHHWGVLLLAVITVAVLVLVFIRLRAEELAKREADEPGKPSSRFRRHLHDVFRSFADGLAVIRNWNDLAASVISSVLLWAVNTSVFWLVFRAWDGELDQLSWLAAGVVLFCAAAGLVVQLPGVGGGFQVGAIVALRSLFGVGAEPATGAAILLWIVLAVPCLALGVVLLLYEGLTFRKLGAMAEKQRAEAVEKI